MVVTVTMEGYIKRTPLDTFRAQAKGGKGRAGMATKDEDAVTHLFVTSTHTPVLFFSTEGKVYRMKVWRLPEGGPATRGRPMVNLLPLATGETISTVLPLPEDEETWGDLHVMFATAKGSVRRNSMDAFANIRTSGKIAMRFEEGSDDRLIGVSLLTEDDDVLLATKQGKAIRFAATDVREFQSRDSTGVRGARLAEGDEVISMSVLRGFAATPQEREDYLRAAPWKEGEREVTCLPSAWRVRGGGGVHPHRHRQRLSASGPPLTNIAAPIAAARASPTSSARTATGRSWPASRLTMASSSCSSPIRPS
jgi:DNA gyrase subunit A